MIKEISVKVKSKNDVTYLSKIKKSLMAYLGDDIQTLEMIFSADHPELNDVYFTYEDMFPIDDEDDEFNDDSFDDYTYDGVLGEIDLMIKNFYANEMIVLTYDENEPIVKIKISRLYNESKPKGTILNVIMDSLGIGDYNSLNDEDLQKIIRENWPEKFNDH